MVCEVRGVVHEMKTWEICGVAMGTVRIASVEEKTDTLQVRERK